MLTRIRLIVAVWCLAAFVLTNSYSTILISYVTSPDWKPLIHSITDIPKTPRLRVVVEEKMGADNILSVKQLNRNLNKLSSHFVWFFQEASSGIFRDFGDMLRHDPSLRCPKPEQCLDKVKSGSYVYIQVSLLTYFVLNVTSHVTSTGFRLLACRSITSTTTLWKPENVPWCWAKKDFYFTTLLTPCLKRAL